MAMTHASLTPLLPVFHQGSGPVLISVPHAGIGLPPGFMERLSPAASMLPDTDWYVDRLYGFARDQGANMLIATASRLLADLNRPSNDQPLYSSSQTQLMTGVLPMQCFSGDLVYQNGQEPTANEAKERLDLYWQPYHDRLQASLRAIVEHHGYAILLDAHSIRSEVPLLFDGQLADLNLGSNGGVSAHPALIESVSGMLGSGRFTLTVDGRFRGGYITRHYGQPEQQVHALQLEIAQRAYMSESSSGWDDQQATGLQQHLQKLLHLLTDWRPRHA